MSNIGNNTTPNFFDTSLTANGTLYADASGVILNVSPGSAGEVLTSNGAGSAPSYQAASGGGVSGPGSSTDRAIATWNGAGGNALFDNSTTNIDSTGRMTNTAQPCFTAILNATAATNVTGDGTIYQVAFDTALVDNGSNFTTGAAAHYTFPITGNYLITTGITFSNDATSGSNLVVDLVFTNNTFRSLDDFSALLTTIFYTITQSVIYNATAGDTLLVNAYAIGGTKTCSILNSGAATGGVQLTWLSGYLLC